MISSFSRKCSWYCLLSRSFSLSSSFCSLSMCTLFSSPFLSISSCSLWMCLLVCFTLCVYLDSLFSEASLPHSSSAYGLSVSLSFRQWSDMGRRGWEGSIRSMSFLRHSASGNCTSAHPVVYLRSATYLLASPGFGKLSGGRELHGRSSPACWSTEVVTLETCRLVFQEPG